MDVVEFADHAISGAAHLRERLARNLPHRVGIEACCQVEDLRAPGPEVVLAAGGQPLDTSAQSPLERVRVGVDHRRNRRAGAHSSGSSSAVATTAHALAASSSETCSAGEWLT